MRGFEPAIGLMRAQIRKGAEGRGFALTRLLTHWAEIAGDDTAAITRPVKVGYGREGMGATLVLLVSSALAPVVQMQLPRLRERVNAAYGYNAIARITLTQTAATGFAEGQTPFTAAPPAAPAPDPALLKAAREKAAPVGDAHLREALGQLAENILHRQQTRKGTKP